ncbi:MAG: ABC transporter permease [Myxococcota bacterium]
MNRKLARLVGENLRRHARSHALASAGIVVGIGTLTFFLALGAGARRLLLGEIFPLDRLEVVAPRASLAADLLGRRVELDDGVARRLAGRPDVRAVHPKMKLAFPARGWGGKSLLGRDFAFEVSGFLDGIDPRLVAGELPGGEFSDFEADTSDADRPVPVIVSRHLLELYNGSIAKAHGWPLIRDWMTSSFHGVTFTVELGRSYLGDTSSRAAPAQRRFRLVGISDKAMTLGMTVPLGYVRRWNARWAGDREAREYSSIVVRVRDKRDATSFVAHVKSLGLEQAESEAERVGLFVTLGTLLFALISVAMIVVSALGVAHTFLMIVAERRREIGVLRAVGASRGDVRAIVLGEAGVVGLVGGVGGLALAWAAARACDFCAARALPDFPFKPATYFHFPPALLLGSVALAVVCALAGAFVPARRAARMEPAEALAG